MYRSIELSNTHANSEIPLPKVQFPFRNSLCGNTKYADVLNACEDMDLAVNVRKLNARK